jgi:hypothetical protein
VLTAGAESLGVLEEELDVLACGAGSLAALDGADDAFFAACASAGSWPEARVEYIVAHAATKRVAASATAVRRIRRVRERRARSRSFATGEEDMTAMLRAAPCGSLNAL